MTANIVIKVSKPQFQDRMKDWEWDLEDDDSLFEDIQKAGFILLDRVQLEKLLVTVPAYVRSSDLFQFIKELLNESMSGRLVTCK